VRRNFFRYLLRDQKTLQQLFLRVRHLLRQRGRGVVVTGEVEQAVQAIEQDFDTFEYSALTVEPHTTRAGFLFYDVSGLAHPLVGAKLHLHKLLDADGHELFYFEIAFDKYLQSKSSAMN